jgi:hypothetical protein
LNFNAFNTPSTGFQKKPGAPYKNGLHVILTLDPTKFAEKKQERFHLGKLKAFRPRVSLLKQSSLAKAEPMEYDGVSRMGSWKRVEFPPDIRAFLYYSMPPGKPRIGGELRLRVTSSDDPASFESGSDLLQKNGRAWARPLYPLSKYHPLLYEKLREDQFVQDDLDAVLSNLPTKHVLYRRSSLLYSINESFIVDFSTYQSNIFVITERGVGRLVLHQIFTDNRNLHNNKRPYTGAYTNRHLSVLQY